MNFLEFTNELLGYHFYDKKSGDIIYKYELFMKKLTAGQVFRKFKAVIR